LEKLGMHASDTGAAGLPGRPRTGVSDARPGGQGLLPHLLGAPGERLIGAAGAVAGAQRVFDQTLKFALERKAFGREIATSR